LDDPPGLRIAAPVEVDTREWTVTGENETDAAIVA
jgi:hypothetical protein